MKEVVLQEIFGERRKRVKAHELRHQNARVESLLRLKFEFVDAEDLWCGPVDDIIRLQGYKFIEMKTLVVLEQLRINTKRSLFGVF